MEVIPELPEQDISEPIGYFADGMLGLYEHLKWPQKYYRDLPHAMAAPANPDLLYFQPLREFLYPEGQTFFVQDTQRLLPPLVDPKAAWFHLTEKHFTVTDELGYAEIGTVKLEAITRLKKSFAEALENWKVVLAKLIDEAVAIFSSFLLLHFSNSCVDLCPT